MKILLLGLDKSSVLKLASPLETAGFDCEKLFTQKKIVEFCHGYLLMNSR